MDMWDGKSAFLHALNSSRLRTPGLCFEILQSIVFRQVRKRAQRKVKAGNPTWVKHPYRTIQPAGTRQKEALSWRTCLWGMFGRRISSWYLTLTHRAAPCCCRRVCWYRLFPVEQGSHSPGPWRSLAPLPFGCCFLLIGRIDVLVFDRYDARCRISSSKPIQRATNVHRSRADKPRRRRPAPLVLHTSRQAGSRLTKRVVFFRAVLTHGPSCSPLARRVRAQSTIRRPPFSSSPTQDSKLTLAIRRARARERSGAVWSPLPLFNERRRKQDFQDDPRQPNQSRPFDSCRSSLAASHPSELLTPSSHLLLERTYPVLAAIARAS
ncbi:hypothetical protein N657DRAFT_640087 [Parathielavia appendiculata]|uniref:Uncharacterized protein n=1 Tax=Parathielavia appendiculata TaxID=2587402 RepID=A0AAN6Z9D8_9PEZI|nr:hypothetical protein N657DRAFT_640087 [Parathielavia appendiculata]